MMKNIEQRAGAGTQPMVLRRVVESAVALAVAVMVGVVLHGSPVAREANRIVDDAMHVAAGKRHEPRHVVLVTVDEASLNDDRLRDVPLAFWAPYFAQVIERVVEAGALVVGVDFLFSASATDWLAKVAPDSQEALSYNATLSAQIAKGRVVLIGEDASAASARRCVPEQPREVLLPIIEFTAALPGFDAANMAPALARYVGLANVVVDDDGVVRRFCTSYRGPDDAAGARYGFGALLARAATTGEVAEVVEAPERLAFAGPAGTFARVSFAALLSGEGLTKEMGDLLRGKVVIVGADYVGAQDVHETPYTRGRLRGGGWMTGAEIHANVTESLLARRRLVELGSGWSLALLLLVAVAIGVASWLRSFAMFVVVSGVVVTAVVAGAWGAFSGSLVVPAGSLLIQALVSFVVSASARLLGVERQREVLRRTFGKYVSPEVLQQLEASGTDVDLAGARPEHEVTVLFSDVRDFTTISEMLPAAEVVALLNDYFAEASKVILANNGTIFKFIGDAVMVVFGNPVFHDDHALRACRTALSLQECAGRVRERARRRYAGRTPVVPEFRIGVGLHTGAVVVGNIGSPERLDYTAIGDTVNAAARLEGLCKPSELGWQVVMSKATLDAALESAGDGVRVVCGGEEREWKIKGRKPMHVCELISITESGGGVGQGVKSEGVKS